MLHWCCIVFHWWLVFHCVALVVGFAFCCIGVDFHCVALVLHCVALVVGVSLCCIGVDLHCVSQCCIGGWGYALVYHCVALVWYCVAFCCVVLHFTVFHCVALVWYCVALVFHCVALVWRRVRMNNLPLLLHLSPIPCPYTLSPF